MQTHAILKIGAILLLITGLTLNSCSKGNDAAPTTTTLTKPTK